MVLETVGQVLDAGSGVLAVLLGLFVVSVKPRRRVNLALAAYCIGLGTAQLLGNLYAFGTAEDIYFTNVLAPPFFWLGGACVIALALLFPRPLARDERRLLLLPVAFYAVSVGRGLLAANSPAAVVNAFLSPTTPRTVFAFALLLFALRFAATSGPNAGRERRQLALMSAAMAMYPTMLFGLGLPGLNPDITRSVGLLNVAGIGLVAGVWLWNTRVPARDEARAARNVALIVLGVSLAGMVLSAPLGGPSTGTDPRAFDSGILGVSRILGAAILAYAILKHQLLDIDMKVRWGIQQSTLGAIFIGVFFVVSNGVQTFFQTTLGPYVGIAVAGGLVFAMAPLQQFADRVASRAMPGVRSLGEMSHPERVALYRDQARLVWSDGQLSLQERELLDIARQHLAITLEEAAAIEREVAPTLPATTVAKTKKPRRSA